MWLQLQGGSADSQRAVYQPFNLAVLTLASVGMLYSGQINPPVLYLALLCLPVTLIGAAMGSRVYRLVTESTFHRLVLTLLLMSGATLVVQAWTQ